jgi:hypothetical protein
MAHVRFFLALALIAAGCALLIASYSPRPMVACWVGGGSHAATVAFFARTGYSTGFKNHDPA